MTCLKCMIVLWISVRSLSLVSGLKLNPSMSPSPSISFFPSPVFFCFLPPFLLYSSILHCSREQHGRPGRQRYQRAWRDWVWYPDIAAIAQRMVKQWTWTAYKGWKKTTLSKQIISIQTVFLSCGIWVGKSERFENVLEFIMCLAQFWGFQGDKDAVTHPETVTVRTQ